MHPAGSETGREPDESRDGRGDNQLAHFNLPSNLEKERSETVIVPSFVLAKVARIAELSMAGGGFPGNR
jgi:hypothetical protein